MKILIIDRDSMAVQLSKSKLEAVGHVVSEESVKNEAIKRLQNEDYETVLLDPSPLSNARPIVLGMRRSVRKYSYIMLMSQTIDEQEALRSGANDVLSKPFDMDSIKGKLENAARLIELITRMGDESEDFPSAGGMISKSAFNQLFLSCIDRADRYGEKTFMVFIGINNYQEIFEMDGSYTVEFASAKLAQYLVRIRRQSDIIAQTGKGEYCLLLQRPQYETEPMDAASRFADAIGSSEGIFTDETEHLSIYVRLIDLPIGTLHVEHIVEGKAKEDNQTEQSSG